MKWIMIEEDYWDHNVEGDLIEGPLDCVCSDVVVNALNEMKAPGKAPESSHYH